MQDLLLLQLTAIDIASFNERAWEGFALEMISFQSVWLLSIAKLDLKIRAPKP
jgi:hypothetical protein